MDDAVAELTDRDLRLGRYFGLDPRFWINLQARHDLVVEMDAFADSRDSIQALQIA